MRLSAYKRDGIDVARPPEECNCLLIWGQDGADISRPVGIGRGEAPFDAGIERERDDTTGTTGYAAIRYHK
jgi:hypothetical protein